MLIFKAVFASASLSLCPQAAPHFCMRFHFAVVIRHVQVRSNEMVWHLTPSAIRHRGHLEYVEAMWISEQKDKAVRPKCKMVTDGLMAAGHYIQILGNTEYVLL